MNPLTRLYRPSRRDDEFDPYLCLVNAQYYVCRRFISSGCFREEGTLLKEHYEALAIFDRAIREFV